MFEDLTRWMTEEVRILETGVRDRVNQIDEMVPLLTSNTGFDQERVHYVKVSYKFCSNHLTVQPQGLNPSIPCPLTPLRACIPPFAQTIFIPGASSPGGRD